MSAFYVPVSFDVGDLIDLQSDESKHIRVLRKSETIKITNGKGQIALARIVLNDRSRIKIKIIELLSVFTENIFNSTLFFGLIDDKNRIEFLIEKTSELGINSIYPVYCKNSQFIKFYIERGVKKAISALKQSERAFLPKINEIIKFNDMIDMLSGYDVNFLADVSGIDVGIEKNKYFSEGKGFLIDKNISLIVGPEGGFSSEELDSLRVMTTSIKLSNSILRTETAAISLLSKLN